jgi:hypothetical protein
MFCVILDLSLPTNCMSRGLMLHLITMKHTHLHTLLRTTLDKGSPHRRDLYMTTHNIQKRKIPMPRWDFFLIKEALLVEVRSVNNLCYLACSWDIGKVSVVQQSMTIHSPSYGCSAALSQTEYPVHSFRDMACGMCLEPWLDTYHTVK